MRLWSLHPSYLDKQGLGALWREALLAQAVLTGKTKGYTRHPQLERFRSTYHPARAVGTYLYHVWFEARRRGYAYDIVKVNEFDTTMRINVTDGQLLYEKTWLEHKLLNRSPGYLAAHPIGDKPHPMFTVISGDVEPWERVVET